MKNLSVTLGIPTCYGGETLVKAVDSIRKSKNAKNFRFLVVADSVPISQTHKKLLKTMNVELTENETPGPQLKKVKQMIAKSHSDIFVITQDDIRFDSHALYEIVKMFEINPLITMVGANILPETATTWFEKIIEVGLRGAAYMGKSWRGGDNYLLANGRCMAFRTKQLKQMDIPDKVVNADAYLYFENKRQGGSFAFAQKAVVYNKSPLTISEHLRQARRFRYSQEELATYFNDSIRNEYRAPLMLRLQTLLKVFHGDPLNTLLYGAILLYSVITFKSDPNARTPMWKVNVTTKRL